MKQNGKQTRSGMIALLITAAGTFLTGMMWLNNLVSAWHYHVLLFQKAMIREVPGGFLPSLNWTAIDVSTVTTFIPFFGFLLMFAGLLKLRSGESWPFFHGYDRLNIALGLIGTLWGIILIGFYPAGQVTIAALMNCLHTAMFSTLAAIAWVMVLEPLIFLPWMNRIRRNGMPDEDEKSLDEFADDLLDRLVRAGEASGQFREELNKLNAELSALTAEIARNRENEKRLQAETLSCLRDLTAISESLRARQEEIAAENSTLQDRCRQLERDLASSSSEAASLKQRLDAVRNALEH